MNLGEEFLSVPRTTARGRTWLRLRSHRLNCGLQCYLTSQAVTKSKKVGSVHFLPPTFRLSLSPSTHTHTHTHTHACLHTCIRVHTHTYTLAHMHTRQCSLNSGQQIMIDRSIFMGEVVKGQWMLWADGEEMKGHGG